MHTAPHAAEHERDRVEADAFAHAARAEAEALFEQARALGAEAHRRHEAHDGAGAHEASVRAKATRERAEAANVRAAEAIFARAQKHLRDAAVEIDLHGLHVDEALSFVTTRLDDARARARSEAENAPPGSRAFVVVIHGAGQHSSGGRPLIKPAVLGLLARRQGGGGAGGAAAEPARSDGVIESYQVDFDALTKAHNEGTTSVFFEVQPGPDARKAAPELQAPQAAQQLARPAAAIAPAPAASPPLARPAPKPEPEPACCCVIC